MLEWVETQLTGAIMPTEVTAENLTAEEIALVTATRAAEEIRLLKLAATPALAFIANFYGFSCLTRMQLPNFTDFLEVTGITDNTFIIYPVVEKILYYAFDVIGKAHENMNQESFTSVVATAQAFVAANTPAP